MKKLIPLFLFFACISSVSAQTTIPTSPECHSGTEMVQTIGDMYYRYKSQQLTGWTNEIQQTRPLTIEEIDEYTKIKMTLLSEYSRPSNKTFALCDAMINTFNQNR